MDLYFNTLFELFLSRFCCHKGMMFRKLTIFVLFIQEYAANYWHQKGAPKSKINVGMAFYGRTWKLANANSNGLGSPDEGKGGAAGPYTKESGILAYYEVSNHARYSEHQRITPPPRTKERGKARQYTREAGILAYYKVSNHARYSGHPWISSPPPPRTKERGQGKTIH